MKGTIAMGSLIRTAMSIHVLSLAGAGSGRAEAIVTEAPGRWTVENDGVRLAFEPAVNHVPTELACKVEALVKAAPERAR